MIILARNHRCVLSLNDTSVRIKAHITSTITNPRLCANVEKVTLFPELPFSLYSSRPSSRWPFVSNFSCCDKEFNILKINSPRAGVGKKKGLGGSLSRECGAHFLNKTDGKFPYPLFECSLCRRKNVKKRERERERERGECKMENEVWRARTLKPAEYVRFQLQTWLSPFLGFFSHISCLVFFFFFSFCFNVARGSWSNWAVRTCHSSHGITIQTSHSVRRALVASQNGFDWILNTMTHCAWPP